MGGFRPGRTAISMCARDSGDSVGRPCLLLAHTDRMGGFVGLTGHGFMVWFGVGWGERIVILRLFGGLGWGVGLGDGLRTFVGYVGNV